MHFNVLHAPAAGLLKRYGLDVSASDILQASLDGQGLPVSVVAQSTELNRCVLRQRLVRSILEARARTATLHFALCTTLPCRLLNTFQSTLDEITIIALPEQPQLDGTAGAAAAVQRSVRIQSFYDPAKGACAHVHLLSRMPVRRIGGTQRGSSTQL